MSFLEYYVRRNADGSFAIAKFQGGEAPETEYRVDRKGKAGKLHCNCPAFQFRFVCKHVPMVAQFINQGEKVPFCVTREEK